MDSGSEHELISDPAFYMVRTAIRTGSVRGIVHPRHAPIARVRGDSTAEIAVLVCTCTSLWDDESPSLVLTGVPKAIFGFRPLIGQCADCGTVYVCLP